MEPNSGPNRHPPDDRLVELSLRPWKSIRKLQTFAAGLACTKIGDAGAFCARKVDFVLTKTHLSLGFHWYA